METCRPPAEGRGTASLSPGWDSTCGGRANPAAIIDFQRLDASDSNDFRTFASISVLDWTDFRFKFYPQCVIFMSSGTFCSQRAKHMRYCSCDCSSFHHSHTFRGRGFKCQTFSSSPEGTIIPYSFCAPI